MNKIICVFLSLCIAAPSLAEAAFVEILGVKVTRGMPESEVRAAFPQINCHENCEGYESDLTICHIDDGEPPWVDGEVMFKDGLLYRASQNWVLAPDSTPYDALFMQNQLLTRLAGESNAVCAKVETYSGHYNETTYFIFPKKILAVRMHSLREKNVMFTESLRVNPVPEQYKVRGKKMQGTEWCGYVN